MISVPAKRGRIQLRSGVIFGPVSLKQEAQPLVDELAATVWWRAT